MSESTARALQETQGAVPAREVERNQRRQELLAAIAKDLPDRMAALAITVALDQPEVTKSLGSPGVACLKDALRTKAQELSCAVEAAVTKIDWPYDGAGYSDYSISTKDLNRVLWNFFYHEADGIAQIFKLHGYDIHDDNLQHAQGLVDTKVVFTSAGLEDRMLAVVTAQNALNHAERAVELAKDAENRRSALSLWGDG